MKHLMIFARAVAGLSIAAAASSGALAPIAAAPVTQGQTAVFAIANMTCPTCPITVKKAMQGVNGVRSVSIDFAAKKATVVFDPRRTNVGAVAAASTNAGYPAKRVG